MSKSKTYRRRRVVAVIIVGLLIAAGVWWQSSRASETAPPVESQESAEVLGESTNSDQPLATEELNKLPIRERAAKDGYSRDQFGNGWAKWGKCDTRQKILARDLAQVALSDDGCTVLSGALDDPYTGTTIDFERGAKTSSAVQIDHVVALSNAWQTGAQELDAETRKELANDDLELLAVEGKANQQKSDRDASEWLPAFKPFRCQYVARQIAVKVKYTLWVTASEHDAMVDVLKTCPAQRLPAP